MSLYKFLLYVARPFWTLIGGFLSVSVAWAILVNIQPYFVRLIVDTAPHIIKTGSWKDIMPYTIGYIMGGLAYIAIFRYYDYLVSVFAPKQREYITLYLMDHLMEASPSFYQKNFAGNLAGKINDVTMETPEIIRIVMNKFFTCLLTLVVSLMMIWFIDPKFSLAMLFWLIVFMGGSLGFLFSHSQYSHVAAESRNRVLGAVVDILTNIIKVRLFMRFRHEHHLLKGHTLHALEQERCRDRFFLRLHFFQGVSFWIYELLCFWWLLWGLSEGTLSSGAFVQIFVINLQILDQFWSLGKEIRDVWAKIGQVKQALKTLFSLETKNISEDKGNTLQVTQGTIVFKNVHFSYEKGKVLFDNKTLEIPGGQKVGLVGFSGSGKSTFINLILRLYELQGGEILIDGQNISQVSLKSLYESIAVVPQECFLFNRTIRDNIRYGKLDAPQEEVEEAAKRAQIHHVISQLPMGYDTMAGEKGSRLSGGQRQRLTIASAIVKNAPILLMDEATSNLDILTEIKVQKAFQEVMKGKTVLVIAHRLTTLKTMDRLLVFNEGKIVQDGHHDELMMEEGLYRQLWNAQWSENETIAS